MRGLLHIVLVTMCVCTDVFEMEKLGIVTNIKERIKGNKNGKMEKLLSRIEKDFKNMPEFRRRLSGCQKTLPKTDVLSSKQIEFLERVKSINTEARRTKDSIEEVNMKSGIADVLFQGDILLSEEQRDQIVTDNNGSRSKRQAYNYETYPGRKWPYTIYYSLEKPLGVTTKKSFVTAAELWMNNTCINFKNDENETAEDLLIVFRGRGCWSDVGRHYDWQFISLGNDCGTVGTAAHEIAHALGFWHTHSRHDRDEFVTILKENIAHDWGEEFAIESRGTNNNYNLPYDYGSVMHYGSTSGGKNVTNGTNGGRLTTMVPKDVLYMNTLGSHIISFYDLLMMNLLYNCTDLCKNESISCQNGGFAHPRNCSKCICPSGYGGDFCNQRPPGCGEVLNATGNWSLLVQDLNDVLQNGTKEGGYRKCTYWIQAPEGKQITVKILELPHGFATDGCTNGGVEIKTHSNQLLTGYRLCSQYYANATLTSNSSMVPVIFYALSFGIEEAEIDIAEDESSDDEGEGGEDEDEDEDEAEAEDEDEDKDEEEEDDGEDQENEGYGETGEDENNGNSGDFKYTVILEYGLM